MSFVCCSFIYAAYRCVSGLFHQVCAVCFSVIFVNNFAFGPQVDHHVSIVYSVYVLG